MHLQRAAVRSCDPPSWPSAAVAVALENLQWGTQSGALLVGTVSTRTCSMRRYADVTFRLDRQRRLRLRRFSTCGGGLGVLTVVLYVLRRV